MSAVTIGGNRAFFFGGVHDEVGLHEHLLGAFSNLLVPV
jgi:hypothetical protein